MPAKTLEMYKNRSEVGQNLSQNKVTKDKRFNTAAHCKTFGIEKEKVECKKSKPFQKNYNFDWKSLKLFIF